MYVSVWNKLIGVCVYIECMYACMLAVFEILQTQNEEKSAYVYVCVCACMNVCVCVCIYACMYVCIYV